MRFAVLRINDTGGKRDDRHTLPVETDQHLGIEVHPPTEASAPRQSGHGIQRIYPESAHRILDIKR
jgi:hypothetical protein